MSLTSFRRAAYRRMVARRLGLRCELLEDRTTPTRGISSTEVLAGVIDPVGPVNEPAPGLSPWARLGIDADRVTSIGGGMVRIATGGTSPDALVSMLQATPGIAWAQPNYVYTVASEYAPNDSKYTSQTNLTAIRVSQAWDNLIAAGKPLGNSGTIVAVLDEGINAGHTDFGNAFAVNAADPSNGTDDDGNGFIDDTSGWDFTAYDGVTKFGDNSPEPDSGKSHGNSVAGVIAARTNNLINIAGIAGGQYDLDNEIQTGGVRILPIRVVDGSNNLTSAGLAAGLNYTASRFVRIANISFDLDGLAADTAVQAAMTNLYNAGTLIVASAGNTGTKDAARGAFDQVLFVGGTNNADKISSTTTGSVYSSNYGQYVDIMAPSEGIYSLSVPSKTTSSPGISGTSFAAPTVAGVAALLLAQNPSYTRDQLAAKLLGTAVNIDNLNPSYAGQMGAGRVDALNALTQTLAPSMITDFKVNGVTVQIGGTVNDISTITLTVPQRLNPASVKLGSFDLRSDGPDNQFNTADDYILTLALTAPYNVTQSNISFSVNGTLQRDHYRFLAKSGNNQLRDTFDSPLNMGNDYVHHFDVYFEKGFTEEEVPTNIYKAANQSQPRTAIGADGSYMIVWQSEVQDSDSLGIFARVYNSSGLPLGNDIQVNTTTAGAQDQPSIACGTDGNFAVVWRQYHDNNGTGIFGRLFSKTGVPLTKELQINSNIYLNDQSLPDIASRNGGYVIAFASREIAMPTNDVVMHLTDNMLNPVGGDFVAGASPGYDGVEQNMPFVASNNNNRIVLIYNSYGMGDDGDVRYRIFDNSGTSLTGDWRANQLASGYQVPQDVIVNDDGTFAISYFSQNFGGPGTGVSYRRFDEAGNPMTGDKNIATSSPGDDFSPVMATDGKGNLSIVWYGNTPGLGWNVYLQKISNTDVFVGPQTNLSIPSSSFLGATPICSIAGNTNGDMVIAWNTNYYGNDDIAHVLYYTSAGSPRVYVQGDVNEIEHNERVVQSVPALRIKFRHAFSTVGEGSISLSSNWNLTVDGVDKTSMITGIMYDGLNEVILNMSSPIVTGNVQVRAFDSIRDYNGNALDGDTNGIFGGDFVRSFTVANIGLRGGLTMVNDGTTPGAWSDVASNASGKTVVVWQSNNKIYGQRFTSEGSVVGSRIEITAGVIAGSNAEPEVAIDSTGNFTVVWSNDQIDGSGYGVIARRYLADGTPAAAAFLVNDNYSTGGQINPKIAIAANGDAIVAWGGPSATSPGNSGIVSRRILPDGTMMPIVTHADGGLYAHVRPAVGIDGAGNYVVVWSYNGFEDNWGLKGQMVRADGTVLAIQTSAINLTSVGAQDQASVAMTPDGRFMVAWTSDGNAADNGQGVYGRIFNSAFVPESGEIPLAETKAGNQSFVQTAVDADGDFAVVWRSDDIGINGFDVLWRRFNSAGVPVTSEQRVPVNNAGIQNRPSVSMAATADGFITYNGDDGATVNGVYLQRFAGNDALTTTGIPTQTFFEDGGGTVPLSGVFTDPNNPTPTFTYSVVGNTNPTLLPNLSFGQQTPQLVWLQVNPAANQSGSSVVTVRAEIPGGLYVDASFAVIVQPVNDAPTFVKGPNLVNVINAVPQTVAGWATGITGGPGVEAGDAVSFEIVSNSNPGLFTTQPAISSGGTLTYAPAVGQYGAAILQVRATDAGGTANNGRDASDPQTFVITIDPTNPNYRAFDGQANANYGLTAGKQEYVSIATDSAGRRVVAWDGPSGDGTNDSYAQIYASNGAPVGGNFRINQTTAGNQLLPKAAFDPQGNILFTWSSGTFVNNDSDVYVRKFNSYGVPVTDEVRVNLHLAGAQDVSSIGVDASGAFVITWMSGPLDNEAGATGQDGDGYGIYARLFDPSGVPLGQSEFPVHTTTTNNQFLPSIAMQPSGGFVIAWVSHAGPTVFARVYDAKGAPVTGEILVSSEATQILHSSVAADADGDFVVAWESATGDGSGSSIQARRFNALGLFVGAAFVANAGYTAGPQAEPGVAMDADGDFIVTWSGEGPGDSQGVFHQRFQRDGSPFGSVTRDNAVTTGLQQQPSVTMDADGDAFVAFSGNGTGDTDGVFVRRHGYPEPTGVGGATIVNNVGDIDLSAYFMNSSGPQEALAYSLDGSNITNPNLFTSIGISGKSLATAYAPGAFGSAEVTVRIADTSEGGNANGVIVIRYLQDANASPVLDFIRNRSIVEGGTLSLTASAVDKTGGKALEYTLLANPPGATLDKASGLLTWTATDSQAANFTVRVTDPDNGYYTQEGFIVTAANLAPTAKFSGPAVVAPNSMPTFSFTNMADASAVDLASLRFSYDYNNDGTWDAGGASYGASLTDTSKTAPGSFFSTAGSTRIVRGRVIDKDGGFKDYFLSVNIENIEPSAPPPTATVAVNDGDAQRSNVRSISVTFSQNVSFPSGMAAAFTLTRTGPGGPTGSVPLTFALTGNVMRIAFAASAFTQTSVSEPSLIDGYYTLTLVAANIQGAGGALNAGTNQTANFRRLFGDFNDDGIVDGAVDFPAFGAGFNVTAPGSAFDFNEDGIVDGAIDFPAFGARFNLTL